MRYFAYIGTVGMSEGGCESIILDDIYNDDKPPVKLDIICQELREYVEGRGWTDKEERYISQMWIYSRLLDLMAIVIPSTTEGVPAKVIACADPSHMSRQIAIFGPEKLINERHPAPMNDDDLRKWISFRNQHGLYPANITD